jgi:hypothetical protein
VNSFSACLLAKNDRIGRARLDLLNRGHAIPLGFTPWNSSSACLVPKNDRINVECLNLVHQGSVIPLGLAPWNAVFPVKQPSLGIIAAPSGQNLCQQGKSISLGSTSGRDLSVGMVCLCYANL